MSLSIIINTYRRPDALIRCLGAIASQLPREVIEVIVVDDGGGLDPEPIETKFAGQLPLSMLAIGPEGRSAARNRGLQAATGKRVLFLGDDVMVQPGCIERHLAQSDPKVAVVGPYPWKGLKGSPPFRRWAEPNPQDRIADPANAGFQFFATGNLSVDRRVLVDLGGFDERFRRYGWEDIDLGLRFERAGGRVIFDPAARAIHEHPEPSRAALWRRELEMGFTAWQFWEKWAIERGAPEAAGFMKFWDDPAHIELGPRWRRAVGDWLVSVLDRIAPGSRLNWSLYERMIFAQRLAGVAEAWRVSQRQKARQ